MLSELALTRLAAFVATGLVIVGFLILGVTCWAALQGGPKFADLISLVYLTGSIAGLSLFYARYEYRNLRDAQDTQQSN